MAGTYTWGPRRARGGALLPGVKDSVNHWARPAGGTPTRSRTTAAGSRRSGKGATLLAIAPPRTRVGVGRRTRIVATIGPASASLEQLVALVDAGMDVARLGFAHGSPEEHLACVRRVREAAEIRGRPVAVLADLPGPKVRTGAFVHAA